MTTTAIREKLRNYISVAEDKKVKAIYNLLEDEISEANEWWKDEKIVDELERREKNYLSGASKTFTLEQTVARAKHAVKKVKIK